MEEQKELFNKIFVELLSGNVDDPNLLSRYIIQLSAHLFNLDKERIKAERVYAKLWESRRAAYTSDKQCEYTLKSSEEWQALESAKASYRMCQQLVMSAKKRLTVLSDMSKNLY